MFKNYYLLFWQFTLCCLLSALQMTQQHQTRQNYPPNSYQNEYQKQLQHRQLQQQQPQQQPQQQQQQQQRHQQRQMRPMQPDASSTYNRYSPGRQNNFENRPPAPGMISELQQQQQQQELAKQQEELRRLASKERIHNKCRISVPKESVKNYRFAVKLREDAAEQTMMIEICCEGYDAMRWHGNTVCRPICENCLNGYCKAPGECECHDGFVQNDNGDCVFTCPMGCLNGRCYLDGSCQCDLGYKLDEARKFCRPICSSGCGQNARHNCTEPEVCGCAKGYQLMDGGCMPVCQPDCGVGGYCYESNKCRCEAGYTFKDNVCQAECYQSCENGICYAQNRCICNEGFTYNERTTQCVPL